MACSNMHPMYTHVRILSSFSGLASLSLVLLALVASMPTPRAGRLWKGVLVALPWLLALWVALTRLQDHWHHWQVCAWHARTRTPCVCTHVHRADPCMCIACAHWHHWQDVLVGSLIGHAAAYGGFRLRFPPISAGLGLVPLTCLGQAHADAKHKASPAVSESLA